MKFSNRPSVCLETKDDKKVWASRSVAVIGEVVCCIDTPKGREVYILMIKRGKACPNEVGKWCLPCGYLDWDEDAADAVKRETWEETGINIDSVITDAKVVLCNFLSYRQPWLVMSEPDKDEFQNVCLHFGLAVRMESLPIITGQAGGEKDECEEISWVNVEEVKSLDVCFNHKERITEFLVHLMTTRK